ncbi:MAG: hypothetical protein WCX88_01315 [Patescibacteria group bacterium]
MPVKKITSKSTLAEVLNHKNGQEILEKYEVPCLFCPMAAMEMNELEIGQICEMYRIDLEGLLKELN